VTPDLDAKLERLKFAILFMIADMCWAKNKNRRMQKVNKKFIRPYSFVHPEVNHSTG